MDRGQYKQGHREERAKGRRGISSDTFCPPCALHRRHHPPRIAHPAIPFLRIALASSRDSASRENTSRGIFRDAVSLVPRRKSLNAIKVFLEKILREVSSGVQR